MAKPDEPYRKLIVESYYPASTSGRKGKVHIRPTLDNGQVHHSLSNAPKSCQT